MGSTGEKKEVTILVTGFGPFQDIFPVNPSFEIAKSLPELLPSTSTHPTAVRIITYRTPVRVSYAEVRNLIPALLDSYAEEIDLVLHIGMASGRPFYTVERYAHREGYDKDTDLDGMLLPSDDGLEYYPDCPCIMTTSLDYKRVWREWQTNVLESQVESTTWLGKDDLRQSEDAGYYLCDFIYFNSLAHLARRSRKFEDGKVGDRPVLFLHVPAESDLETLERGKMVAVGLLRAMAEEWVDGSKATLA